MKKKKNISTENLSDIPLQYFFDFFSYEIIDYIIDQSNLYHTQVNQKSSLKLDRHEFLDFLGIIIWMGIIVLPAIRDYWEQNTRVNKFVSVMKRNRF